MEGRNQSKSKRTTRTESSPEIAAGAPPCQRAVACGRRRRVAALGRAGAWSGGAGACECVRAVRLCEGVPVRAWGGYGLGHGRGLQAEVFRGLGRAPKRIDTRPAHVQKRTPSHNFGIPSVQNLCHNISIPRLLWVPLAIDSTAVLIHRVKKNPQSSLLPQSPTGPISYSSPSSAPAGPLRSA